MKKFLLLLGWAALSCSAFGQTPPRRVKAGILPAYRTLQEMQVQPFEPASASKTQGWQMPAGMRIPGEFEESQAVLLAWPYPGSGTDEYAVLWSRLINAIQQEVPALILLDFPSDTVNALSDLAANGVTLSNGSRFVFHPGDAFWARDYGPIGFYYGPQDSIGFVDLHYYSGRPKDDAVNAFIAPQFGYRNYPTALRMEGGNFMTDGYGRIFHSTRVQENNNSIWSHSPAWPWAQTEDTLAAIFNSDSIYSPTALVCDGGTGHIDMYMKLIDEQNFVISQYPTSISASDRATIESNVLMLASKTSTYNRPYHIHRINIPTMDDGSQPSSCNQVDFDPRGFVNGLFVNKTFIYPSFVDATSGNPTPDSLARATYEKLLPGYTLKPIDARLLTPMGGAIHCITMQIPAENPIDIWHPSIEGNVALNPNGYYLEAKAHNKSGIASVVANWRKRGTTNWNQLALNKNTASGNWDALLQPASIAMGDTIEYFLKATANNSKTITKPYTAPVSGGNGRVYAFQIAFPQATEAPSALPNFVLVAQPNPAVGATTIRYFLNQSATTNFQLTDVSGRLVRTLSLGSQPQGMNSLQLSTEGLAPGVYFYSMMAGNQNMGTRRLVVQ